MTNTHTARNVSSTKKYLSFVLGAEEYCLDILKIREIIGYQTATAIPHAPPFVTGVINLRGQVLPVVELRLRLAKKIAALTETTCIIIVDSNTAQAGGRLGIIVDAVREVTIIDDTEIDHPQYLDSLETSHCVKGLAKHNGKVRILLDADQLLPGAAISNFFEMELTGQSHH